MRVPPDTNETLIHRPKLKLSVQTVMLMLGAVGLCGVTVLVGVVFYLYTLTQTTPLTLIIAGESRLINTRAETIGELLTAQGITLFEGDELSIPPDTAISEGLTVEIDRARTVAVTVDAVTTLYRTTLTNPANILTNLGIPVTTEDRVLLDGTEADPLMLKDWPVPINQISIRRAVPLTVIDNGTLRTLRSNRDTVGDALFHMGVEIYQADAVEPPFDTPLTPEMTITIYRAVPVTVEADGVTIETRTRAETVRGLLADAGVALNGLDYAIPREDVAVRPDMTVRVIRVKEELINQTSVIPFEQISQADSSLELDEVRLIQAGENGVLLTMERIRYENGVEVSRILDSETLVVPPKNRIVAYGTGVVVRTISTPDGERQYWRKIRMLTTSYHPAALGGDNITATGRVLTKGIIGVDPTVIPYGTELYVPGYGVGVAADTGGPRSTRLWIDLGYDDENWVPWSGYYDVYILTPVPDTIQYVLPD